MKVIDPVCGMSIESGKAEATEHYQGQAFYFCSTHCRDTFQANPAQYSGRGAEAGGAEQGHDSHGHGAGHRH